MQLSFQIRNKTKLETKMEEVKRGVTSIGYVFNLRTFVQELNSLLSDHEEQTTAAEINQIIDSHVSNGSIEYRNKFGKLVKDESLAIYAIFKTKKKSKSDEEIIVFYDRQRIEKNWIGIYFSTQRELDFQIKDNLMFKIGDLKFENWQDGLQFLDDLKMKCIPEKWSYQSHQSGIPHPILKSYIENIFEKLKVENNGQKILKSDDKKYLIFNSGLLDKFFHEIFIIAHTIEENGFTWYRNPYIMGSLSDLTRIGFQINGKRIVKSSELPQPASFFNNISDIVFHPDIEIDRNYDKFTHIIDERRDRFPNDAQNLETTELSRKLDNAIDDAIAIAKRNYKLVVPMYRPQEDKIQLLMPIYLSGSFTRKPDFALVLDLEDGIYTPETILPLDAAYQNARLIAKPDELWLNPDDM